MNKSILALCLMLMTSIALAHDGIVRKKSANSVETTLDRLESIVKEKGFTVFVRIDHSAGASKVGEKLRPNQVLIFGNPKVGTALMSSSQSAGLDLPIRVAAWQDAKGQVWIAYHEPASLAAKHSIADRAEVVTKMTGALDNFTNAASRIN